MSELRGTPRGWRPVDPVSMIAYEIRGGEIPNPDTPAYVYACMEGLDPLAGIEVLMADVDDQVKRWVPFLTVFRAETGKDLECDELDRRDEAHYYGRPYEPRDWRPHA